MNETSGGELISIDMLNDTAEIFQWPAGDGSWNILPLSDDRLAISTYYDGKFLVFDMRSREWTPRSGHQPQRRPRLSRPNGQGQFSRASLGPVLRPGGSVDGTLVRGWSP